MFARVPQELGRSCDLRQQAVTADRRKTKGRRMGRRESELAIVPLKQGNTPQWTQWREGFGEPGVGNRWRERWP